MFDVGVSTPGGDAAAAGAALTATGRAADRVVEAELGSQAQRLAQTANRLKGSRPGGGSYKRSLIQISARTSGRVAVEGTGPVAVAAELGAFRSWVFGRPLVLAPARRHFAPYQGSGGDGWIIGAAVQTAMDRGTIGDAVADSVIDEAERQHDARGVRR